MASNYTPTLKDTSAARLFHELTAPDEPFNPGVHSKTRYDDMKRYLKMHHYVFTSAGVWELQIPLPGIEEAIDDPPPYNPQE